MKNINIKIFFYKVLNFFIKKYLSFPTLQFIISTNNNFVKNLYINFWISLSKKKNYFYKFFFKASNGVNYKINIDIKKKNRKLK